MCVILHVHRVSMTAFEDNQRAICPHEKIGLKYEGKLVNWIDYEGKR